MDGVNISIYLDKRRKKTNGLFPVKLRVYFQKDIRLYNTGVELSEGNYEKSYLAIKPRQEYKDVKWQLTALENKAKKIIMDLNVFTFEAFDKKMFRATGDRNNIIYHYQQYIDNLRYEKRIGTADNYNQSLNSIKKFLAGVDVEKEIRHLPFEYITPAFLNRYEIWMLEKGKQRTTVGIYLRPLRTIFNAAIEANDIPKELYPFGKRKYQIPAGRNIKKALDKNALGALYRYPVEPGSHRDKAKDFWFLSYQCNGMNMRDIVELRYENLKNGFIVFIRAKTRNTTKANSKSITVPITENIQRIIDKYGKAIPQANDYIFSILTPRLTEIQKVAAVKNFTRFVNQHIKLLAAQAGLTEDISTYWARHSFTTVAIQSGASMEYIQESLGHNSLNTTKNYFAGFEENVKRDLADKLMNF